MTKIFAIAIAASLLIPNNTFAKTVDPIGDIIASHQHIKAAAPAPRLVFIKPIKVIQVMEPAAPVPLATISSESLRADAAAALALARIMSKS